jgi:hypothetical protein
MDEEMYKFHCLDEIILELVETVAMDEVMILDEMDESEQMEITIITEALAMEMFDEIRAEEGHKITEIQFDETRMEKDQQLDEIHEIELVGEDEMEEMNMKVPYCLVYACMDSLCLTMVSLSWMQDLNLSI